MPTNIPAIRTLMIDTHAARLTIYDSTPGNEHDNLAAGLRSGLWMAARCSMRVRERHGRTAELVLRELMDLEPPHHPYRLALDPTSRLAVGDPGPVALLTEDTDLRPVLRCTWTDYHPRRDRWSRDIVPRDWLDIDTAGRPSETLHALTYPLRQRG